MPRSRDTDACPGALQVHQAADGALVRVRLPGGMITADQLATLADAASTFGSATLELTSRGNLQLRGITDLAAVAHTIATAGMLPSATHERVRNIVASPLSGRAGGHADVRPWVQELDKAVCADPRLAQLGGRFWFSLDNGCADVSGLAADIGVHVVDETVALLLTGRDTGVRLPVADITNTLIELATRFVDIRGKAWRVAELDDLGDLLPNVNLGDPYPAVTRPPVGWIRQKNDLVALGAAVPLGVLPAQTAHCIASIAAEVQAPLVVTPWRSVLVCDLDDAVADAALRVLAPLGLVFDENSPWLSISACTGSPGCAHSAADVRGDAARTLGFDGTDSPTHRHFVGCERACGSPQTGDVLIATEAGYRLLQTQRS